MNQPRQPEDHPAPEDAAKRETPTLPATGQHGVPDGAHEGEATGWPRSDREQTEKAPSAS